ncbi:MAG: methyl-accepting chemotaxis protein [Spirochaetota bacterium]
MKEQKISFFKSIGGKITLMFVAVVVLALGAVTLLSVRESSDSLMESQFAQLRAIREIKAGQIETYFDDRRGDMNVLSETVVSLQREAFNSMKAVHANKQAAVETYFSQNSVNQADLSAGGSFEAAMQSIFADRTGLGETGESYLVQKTDSRYYYRSDIKTNGDGDYVYGYDATSIVPSYLRQAHEGASGSDVFTDSDGTLVMAVYSQVEAGGYNFAMVTKMDLEDAVVPDVAAGEQDYYQQYISGLGYYDLFLVHPEGQVFYSVAKEKDYGTNIVDGQFSDSSLGEAVREALSSKEFSFGDFRPYAPSDGAPAAFIAQPIITEGNTDLVVALQMPLEQINAIMQERTGMGETGESYLVGPENLMRSDSFIDPENHSVEASFARPQTGRIETEATKAALSGESAARIITDYTGNQVLSAFGPVEAYDTQWALLSEINESEVQAPINTLTNFILVTALVMILIAIVAAVLFSRTISKPILLIVAGAKNLSIGDTALSDVNEQEFARIKNRSDELGVIGTSFSGLIDYQSDKARIAKEIANKNLQVEANVSSDKDTLGKSFREMVDSLNELLSQVNNAVEQVNNGADQVSQASQNLSQGATEQASSLEEITSSTNEINSQSKQNAENATEALSIAKQATSDAESGNQQMKQMSGIMARINASSDEINKVVKVIDDIAFQINLLALNANVEAARAGKYGKGFAVVADEVRNLAVKSADSVKETTEMVEETVSNIRQGTEAAEETASQLDSIVSGSGKVADFLEEIAQASREQAQAISQITEGLDQIDEATQANTASAEESASASEELAGQAQQLRAMVAEFKLDSRYTGGQVKQLTAGSHLQHLNSRTSGNGNGNGHGNGSVQGRGSSRGDSEHEYSWSRSSETGIKPVKPEEQIRLDDDDFDRF